MDINQIQQTVENCLKNKEDMNSKAQMDSAISGYLQEYKCTDEILPIVIKAMAVDRGSNFYDYLSELMEKDLQDIMKVIRNSKIIKEGGSANGLRMLVGMLYLSVIEEGKISSIRGEIIDLIVSLIYSSKAPIAESVYIPIFDDYFVNAFDGSTKFPEWKKTVVKEESIVKFCDILSKVVGERNNPAIFSIKKWINEGSKYANDALERKRLEAQIPKSRIDEILSIADHYKNVEGKLREKVYEIDKLQKQITFLEDRIAHINKDKSDLEIKLRELEGTVEHKQKTLDKAEKEIGERKALNDAFDALKKNDESALLRDIGNDLKTDYSDFKDSENDEMDITLGEIYREKIRNIFKILEKKGVKVS